MSPMPPLLQLDREEAVLVADGQRLHDRMLGQVGLDQHPAGPLLAAGAAGHLIEQLERPLGGAQVTAAQAEVGVDDPDQREVGEVVALGDDLGADQDVDRVALHRLDQRCRGLGVARGVAGHHREPGLGRISRQLLGEPLDARAGGGQQADGAAARTVLGHGHGVAAMMALQPAAQPMRRPARPSSSGRRGDGRRRGTG